MFILAVERRRFSQTKLISLLIMFGLGGGYVIVMEAAESACRERFQFLMMIIAVIFTPCEIQ